MTTLGQRGVDRAGNREHVAALLGRLACRDQRAGLHCRLDDKHAGREAADDPVPFRKVARQRRRTDRIFADDAAFLRDALAQGAVAGGIGHVRPRADDGDRSAAAAQRALVRGRVDAQREAGHDAQAGTGQAFRECLRIRPALRTGIAAADDGQARPIQQMGQPSNIKKQRRIGDPGQQFGIAGLAQRDGVVAGPGEPVQRRIEQAACRVGRRLQQRVRLGRRHVGGQCRNVGGEDGVRAAERRQQRGGRARSDAGGALQAEPGCQGRGSCRRCGKVRVLHGGFTPVIVRRRRPAPAASPA